MRKSRACMLASVLSFCLLALSGSAASAANLTNHGGPVMVSAHEIFIFYGPTFSDAASPDHAYATTLQAYRNQLGTTSWYNVLMECGVWPTNLGAGTADMFDTTTPPINVTDSVVQAEINKYLSFHTKDNIAIYTVVLPKTSYSSSGSSTSCGGPSFAYCAYHSWIGSGTAATKYAVQPYPSCSGCKVAGWTDVQNQEQLVGRETANTVTDPTGSGCYDSAGSEVGSKCSLTFLSGGFGYPYLWSNAAGSCVQ